MIFKPNGSRDLGEYPEAAGRAVQGSGCGECVSALFILESLLQKEKDHVEGFARRLPG